MYRKLGRQINDVRTQRVSRNYPKEFIDALDGIGFSWDPREERWSKRLEELKQYFEIYGDFKVEKSCKEYPLLGSWVASIRKNRPSEERYQRLLAIGYDWEVESTKAIKTKKKKDKGLFST